MRYPAAEKLEIIQLVEQSHLCPRRPRSRRKPRRSPRIERSTPRSSTISAISFLMRALPKELTFFAIMMKAPRPPMLLARADEGDGTGQLGPRATVLFVLSR